MHTLGIGTTVHPAITRDAHCRASLRLLAASAHAGHTWFSGLAEEGERDLLGRTGSAWQGGHERRVGLGVGGAYPVMGHSCFSAFSVAHATHAVWPQHERSACARNQNTAESQCAVTTERTQCTRHNCSHLLLNAHTLLACAALGRRIWLCELQVAHLRQPRPNHCREIVLAMCKRSWPMPSKGRTQPRPRHDRLSGGAQADRK